VDGGAGPLRQIPSWSGRLAAAVSPGTARRTDLVEVVAPAARPEVVERDRGWHAGIMRQPTGTGNPAATDLADDVGSMFPFGRNWRRC
jgi:hypothetical protein